MHSAEIRIYNSRFSKVFALNNLTIPNSCTVLYKSILALLCKGGLLLFLQDKGQGRFSGIAVLRDNSSQLNLYVKHCASHWSNQWFTCLKIIYRKQKFIESNKCPVSMNTLITHTSISFVTGFFLTSQLLSSPPSCITLLLNVIL